MKTISPQKVLSSIGETLLSNLEEWEHSNDIFLWLRNIVTEKKELIEFSNHCFLRQPYNDWSPAQVFKKGAQVGVTTMALLKAFFFAQKNKIDIISIFLSATDVRKFCQGRFDAIVSHNPLLNKYLVGLDSTELKEIGESRIYFQGSWTKRSALSVPADLLYIDELDRCRPDVLEMYEDRSIDLVITSPPYLNSRDYTDIYRLELWTLRYLKTYRDERELRKSTLRSHVQIAWHKGETLANRVFASASLALLKF